MVNVHFYVPCPSLGASLVLNWARSASVHTMPSASPTQEIWKCSERANYKAVLLSCRPAMTSHSSGHPHCTCGNAWFRSGYCCLTPIWILLSGVRNSLYLGFASLNLQLSLSKQVLPLVLLDWKRLKMAQTGGLTLQDLLSDWDQCHPVWLGQRTGRFVGTCRPGCFRQQSTLSPRPAEKHWHCHSHPQLALRPQAMRTWRCIYTYILFGHQGHREDMGERKKGQGEPSLYSYSNWNPAQEDSACGPCILCLLASTTTAANRENQLHFQIILTTIIISISLYSTMTPSQ